MDFNVVLWNIKGPEERLIELHAFYGSVPAHEQQMHRDHRRSSLEIITTYTVQGNSLPIGYMYKLKNNYGVSHNPESRLEYAQATLTKEQADLLIKYESPQTANL